MSTTARTWRAPSARARRARAWVCDVPAVRLSGRWPAFEIAVVASYGLGAVAVLWLAAATGRLEWPLVLALEASAGAMYGVALLSKRLARAEAFTFHHFQLGVLAAAGATLWACGAPVLAGLDFIGVGLALAQGAGRPGCLLAGCCHGRPGAWGVRYREAHVRAGLPRHLVGVTLLPSQLFELLWLVGVAVLAAAAIVSGRPAGSALALYLAGHAGERFVLQFLRGDPARRYWLGVPEAQWNALLDALLAALLGAGGNRGLTGLVWPALLMAVALAVLVVRRRSAGRPLLDPRHVEEVAQALERLDAAGTAQPVRVEETSAGVRLSSSLVHLDGPRRHYALSRLKPALAPREARTLAWLVARLRHAGARPELRSGGHGVSHVLLP